MASYSPPSLDAFQSLSGLAGVVFGMEDEDFSALYSTLRPFAEADVAGAVGEAEFAASDLTTYEVARLQRAVADKVAFRMIGGRSLNQILTGTQEPLLTAEPSEFLRVLEAMAGSGGILNTTSLAAAQVGDAAGAGLVPLQTGELTFPEQE